MPKKKHEIVEFHGGISNFADPRDIDDNESVNLTDVSADSIGKLRANGSFSDFGSIIADNAVTINNGYGLFFYGTDHDLAGNSLREEWIAMADTDSSAQIDLFDRDDGGTPGWTAGAIDLGTTTGMKPCFYASDGVLRVSDGNFGSGNQNKWRAYIDRYHFKPGGVEDVTIDSAGTSYTAGSLVVDNTGTGGTGFAGTYTVGGTGEITSITVTNYGTGYSSAPSVTGNAGGGGAVLTPVMMWDHYSSWYNKNNTLDRPSEFRTHVSQYPTAGQGFVHVTTVNGSGGNWVADRYDLAVCYVYDGNQGSKLFLDTTLGYFTVAVDGSYISLEIRSTAPYDPRLTGAMVFCRNSYSSNPWTLLCEIDLAQGARAVRVDTFTEWTVNDLNEYTVTIRINDNPVEYYESIFGYSPEDDFIIGDAGYGFKTAVISNRRCYIANVKRKDDNNNDITDLDSIYKSPYNMFDVFPYRQRVTASVGDGEETIKLEEFSDRILQFKDKTLYIINTSQDIEFLESVFKYRGISNQAASCKTDFGVAFANKYGVFLYNGQTVEDLFIKEGKRKISSSWWSSFYTDNIMIGYSPIHRKLFIINDSSSSDRELLIYNLIYRGFEYKPTGIVASKAKTNLINDWNGNLIFAANSGVGDFYYWNDSGASSVSAIYQSKDIDFKSPDMKKNVNKIYFTYTGGTGQNLTMYYNSGNSTTWSTIGSLDSTLTSQVVESFNMTTKTSNIKSIAIKGVGNIASSFELNNITIVYRDKGIR